MIGARQLFRLQKSIPPQAASRHYFLKMQHTLTKGLGTQDHALIGKAAKLPGVATGQYVSIAPVFLPSPDRPVELQMRITAPSAGNNLPIVLLSHGHGPSNNLSSMNGYAPTAQFYAAHGFVVIQPTHLSSRSLSLPENQPHGPMFWRSRVQDLTTILDHLDDLESAIPFVQGRLDRSRIIVWGHSMGSHTAAALLGMRATGDVNESDLLDPRIKLGILIGAIGTGSVMTENTLKAYPVFSTTNYDTLTTPTLVVAGDADDSLYMNTRGWRWHTEAYERGPGAKDLLVMHGGNHSFGGISGWDSIDCKLFDEESPEMSAATLRLTLAYMRGKLYEGDASWREACEALEETDLGHVESK